MARPEQCRRTARYLKSSRDLWLDPGLSSGNALCPHGQIAHQDSSKCSYAHQIPAIQCLDMRPIAKGICLQRQHTHPTRTLPALVSSNQVYAAKKGPELRRDHPKPEAVAMRFHWA